MENSNSSPSAAATAASPDGVGEAGSNFASGGTPLNLLSLGAGVQSSTAALKAARGEITPMPDAAIFSDTRAEPKSVYLWLDWLEKQLPYPIYRVSAGSLTEGALTMKKTADGRLFSKSDIPIFVRNHDGSQGKIVNRACTRDYKLYPIFAKCRELIGPERLIAWRRKHRANLKEYAAWIRETRLAKKEGRALPLFPGACWKRMQDDALAVQWIGISLDEIQRMKPSRVPYLRSRWPLIEQETNRHDCLRWMEEKGYPQPPRSACVYCPFHNDHEWRRLKEEEPDEFAAAVKFERDLQTIKAQSSNFKTTPFLHRSLVPLDQVDFSTEEDRGQLSLFGEECEGMCGA